MAQNLSYDLPALTVRGNRIVNADSGAAVLLRGINRSGLEYSSPDGEGSLEKAAITEAEMDAIVIDWRANIIRLPFNQDWALSRPGYDAEPYLSALDSVIGMAARRGAYILLDLQWIDAVTPRGSNSDGTPNFVPPLPNQDSLVLWQQIARRYREETAVLYDIFNEPHDALPDDPLEMVGIGADGSFVVLKNRTVTMAEWQSWAAALIEAIRTEHSTALIFVSGTDWGFDLRGLPLPDIDGVVYSTHVYPNKGRDWDGAFGDLAEEQPVFVGEWGGTDTELQWGQDLADYMEARQLGWTAWSWSDKPRLVQPSSAPGYVPTAFGQLVRDRLNA
jgi:endoglucanase